MIRRTLILLCLLFACAPRPLEKFEETRDRMGTLVRLTVYHGDAEQAKPALDAAFLEMERLEGLLSSYDEKSEVSRLNREGKVNAGPETLEVIEKSLYYSDLSDGAFDITVKPILDLYARSFKDEGRAPTDEEIAAALEHVGYKGITIDGHEVSLPPEGAVTLGGVAKGYIIDQAVKVLMEHGIAHALVDVGGDLRALGDKMRKPFQVALRNPRDAEDYITVLPLKDGSVATSGDYERFFEPTKTFHHIIDPRTGHSATDLISVTVTAKEAVDADALATSVFVLGPEKGMALVESLKGVEALIITSKREVLRSSGLEAPREQEGATDEGKER